ncbi:hypothetical protein C8R47DRAFT_251585 [Mycena vitilis]|nr:hypothetical protein C8R47DRAFT_251585 [Mycena vitilis]
MLTQGGSNTTSAHLAALLASALSDADALREELGTQKRRTEMTERLLETFNEVTTSMRGETGSGEGQLTVTAGAGFTPTSPGPATTTLGATVSSNKTDTAPTRTLPPETRALLLTLEQRTVLAERGRDEALARLAAAQDIWGQLDEYLIVVEQRAAHARASFTRIVQDGGGPLMLLDIPLPSASPHPHPSYFSSSAHYPSNTSVYPPPAVDPSNSRYPRHRGREEFGGLALPPLPGHEARGRERVHTGEGRASESVARTGSKRQREETMHLPAWGGNSSKKTRRDGWEDEPNHSLPHHSSSATSHLSSTQRPHTYHNSQGERSPSTSDDVDAMLLESAKASPRHPSRFSTHRPFLQHPLSQGDKVKDAVPVFPYPALVKIGPSGVPEAVSLRL